MFSCLQILESFLWFVLITILNVTLIILTLSVSRLLNLLLRLVAFLLFLNPQCLASISRWITASSFFFFQAEDGIRDSSVTGVQTCALPISPLRSARPTPAAARARGRVDRACARSRLPRANGNVCRRRWTYWACSDRRAPRSGDRKSVV